jgi:histone H1/5
MISFKCTLPLGKRMALDSVKGTVSGQCIISIPASASKNIDVKQAVNTGYLQKVGDVKEIEKAKEISKVSAKPKEIKEIIRDMYKDEDGLDKTTIALDTDSEKTNDNNAILELDEVVMSDIKTSTEDKKEPPMNRADDKKKSELQKIGSDIYSQEETVEAPKKIGRPKKTTSKVAVKKATAKKRGRPAKAKTEAEVKAPVKATAKKRGRPAKAKVEVESKASAPKKRGRPAKTTK